MGWLSLYRISGFRENLFTIESWSAIGPLFSRYRRCAGQGAGTKLCRRRRTGRSNPGPPFVRRTATSFASGGQPSSKTRQGASGDFHCFRSSRRRSRLVFESAPTRASEKSGKICARPSEIQRCNSPLTGDNRSRRGKEVVRQSRRQSRRRNRETTRRAL